MICLSVNSVFSLILSMTGKINFQSFCNIITFIKECVHWQKCVRVLFIGGSVSWNTEQARPDDDDDDDYSLTLNRPVDTILGSYVRTV